MCDGVGYDQFFTVLPGQNKTLMITKQNLISIEQRTELAQRYQTVVKTLPLSLPY